MKVKYHLSPDGPRICNDKSGLCPYAKAGMPHFDSQEDAQSAYDSKMKETFGQLSRMRKTEGVRQSAYRALDRLAGRVTKVTEGVKRERAMMLVEMRAKTARIREIRDGALEARRKRGEALQKFYDDSRAQSAQSRADRTARREELLEGRSVRPSARAAARAELLARATREVTADRERQAQKRLERRVLVRYARIVATKKLLSWTSSAAHSVASRADSVLDLKYAEKKRSVDAQAESVANLSAGMDSSNVSEASRTVGRHRK